MNELQQKAARSLARFSGKRIALGVSGGRDSVCLLHAVTHCGAVKKSDILCVHVNHGLRESADRDERFVRALCEKYGVRFGRYEVDVKGRSAATGQTVEQAARDLRHGIFAELIASGEVAAVLTAHHALDNAESVLMHMFRGAGLDGLRGMSGESELGVIRPFIDVYPNTLDEYCREYGLEHVLDETNLEDDADRNFIRLNVLPLVVERYRGAVRSINALAAECAEACAVLDATLDPAKVRYDRGAVVINGEALGGTLAARYVRQALSHFSLTDVTRAQIMRVVGLKDMRTGAAAELSNGVVAAREYDGVALYVPRRKCEEVVPISLGANLIDGLAVDVTPGAADPKTVHGGVVDLDGLEGACLRFRRDGDVFEPYGGGRKKLKQYFIDRKIPARLRDRIPLICRGSEVLVVVGHQISDGLKLGEKTRRIATVSLRWQ